MLLFAEYIQTIMMMEESVQHVVMTAIQEVSPRLWCVTDVPSVSVCCSLLFNVSYSHS